MRHAIAAVALGASVYHAIVAVALGAVVCHAIAAVVLVAVVCHAADPFAETAFLINVHCNESLVWFKAFGFCYTINTGSSLRLLLGILLLSSIMEIP